MTSHCEGTMSVAMPPASMRSTKPKEMMQTSMMAYRFSRQQYERFRIQ